MTVDPPRFSICIPSYNRAIHLPALLDSILVQDYVSFEIVICEDLSPERPQIVAIAQQYRLIYPGIIRLILNEQNLGYDANIRNLIEKAVGQYCFFMGNDDLMCPGALKIAADIIVRYPEVGFLLRSYAWFDEDPECPADVVRYFNEERKFSAGAEAIGICFRRSGVISGYIVHRASAHIVATNEFDGSLYYQMHLTANILATKCAVFTPNVLVLCRNSEPPDFGNSVKEKGIFVPGEYTPEARLRMIGGALSIITNLKKTRGIDLVEPITHDYANYFYPYIRDQLHLPLPAYLRLYRSYASMGFWRYPMFHFYCFACYVFKEKRFDALVKAIRKLLGRSPQFGIAT